MSLNRWDDLKAAYDMAAESPVVTMGNIFSNGVIELDDISKKKDININFKYNEGEILSEITKYVESTYSQHYVGKEGIQTLDVWESLDIAAELCQGTALKYLMRFGKKDGYNKKDLLKAIHYIVLLMHFTDDK